MFSLLCQNFISEKGEKLLNYSLCFGHNARLVLQSARKHTTEHHATNTKHSTLRGTHSPAQRLGWGEQLCYRLSTHAQIDPGTLSCVFQTTFQASSTQHAHAQRKQMGPVDVNGNVHTARKQHQRICIRICVRVSCVDWASVRFTKEISKIPTNSPPPKV